MTGCEWMMASASSDPSKVSVILPIYNGQDTLLDCVQALLRQRDIELEVLAFDDASTDSSRQILVGPALRDARLKVLSHESNAGLSKTLNEGLRKARHEIVLIIHQDCVVKGDSSLLEAVKTMARLKADLVSGIPWAQSATDLERIFLLIRAHRLDLQSPRSIPWTEFKCDVTRRDLIPSVGGFNENYRISGEDQELCLRLRKKDARLFQIPELRYYVRVETKAGWIPHLKKEYQYGNTQAVLLVRTSLRILNRGTKSFGGERLWNRILGTVWILAGLLGLITYGIFGLIGLLPFEILYLLRLAILALRIPGSSYGLSVAQIPRVWVAGSLADLVYSFGLGRGTIGCLIAPVLGRLR